MSIEFKKVNYIYGENTPFSYIALKDVSLKIPQGSFTALIGHTAVSYTHMTLPTKVKV